MRGRLRVAAVAALCVAVVAGCASPPPAPPPPRETYMVMPEGDGRVGVLEVTLNDGRTRTLRGEYQALAVTGERDEAFTGDDETLRRTFGEAVAALPRPPANRSLFFLRGRDELTAESRASLDAILSDFRGRQSQEIWIVGHTDTVGSDAFNDALSLRRAERVRQLLISMGVPADGVVVKGRGKRDPKVPTPDNVDEPRNRRVEISVR